MVTKSSLVGMIGVVFLTSTIVGCKTATSPTATTTASAADTTTPSSNVSEQDRQTSLASINSWRINGKIAVYGARDSGSASVNWVQNRGHYSISLLGPLGSHGLKLTGDPGHVNLQTSDGKSYQAANPEQLLAQRWGFHLPVSNMRYWVRGLPVPGPAKTQFDNEGRLTDLVQQGWHVQYQSYTKVSRVDLPDRISITSPSLRVKIVIYQWNIG